MPLALMDLSSFWQSTITYLSGKAVNSYPVAGYGWGMVLSGLGVINDLNSYYHFWHWQLAICLPLFLVLAKWIKKKIRVWKIVFAYGFLTSVFWYFSRYFNNSHLGYLSLVCITAWGFYEAEER